MTTAAPVLSEARSATRAEPGYSFRSATRMEWLKLRSVRSTSWIVLVFAAGMIGLAIPILIHLNYGALSAADKATFDPTNDGFAGLAVGQLALGVLGVLVMTGEFSSGMIRATFAAAPRRPLVLAAKAAIVAAVALVAGEILAFIAFFVGEAVLRSPAPHATLGQPGVLRAVLMAGAYVCLSGLFGLGLGAIIRRTAGGIAAATGVIFVVPFLVLPLPESIRDNVVRFLPEQIAASSVTAVKPESHALTPWLGFGMLCLYAVILLGAGALMVAKRDV